MPPEKPPNSPRQIILRILRSIEMMMFYLHLVGLCLIILIHLFLPTKLFLGLVGFYNRFERGYWFYTDNMTEESGVYGPLFMVLKEDSLWILQHYIPVLLPLVIVHHYLEGKESLMESIFEFFFKTLLTAFLALVAGSILGAILFAITYVFSFGFTSPEISVNIGEVLDFPASGILFCELLFSALLLALGLDLDVKYEKRWVGGIIGATISLMILLNSFLKLEVALIGEGTEITVYAYHWLEYEYKKEDVMGLHPLIVRKTENQRIDYEPFLSTLACKEGGIDCSTYTFPNLTLNFIDESGTQYQGMEGFFHDRPSEIWLEGSTIQLRYQLIRKDIPKNKSEKISLEHQKWAKLPDIENRNSGKLLIRPLSQIRDWGIQIICGSETEENHSIVILAQEKELSFHMLEGDTLSQRLFFAEIEGISELMVVNNGDTSIFADNEPLYHMNQCDAEHYAPVSW